MKNIILADEFIKCTKQYPDTTWDDFFDKYNIEFRSDFVIAAIVKQANEKLVLQKEIIE
jgi:hypothetical protein